MAWESNGCRTGRDIRVPQEPPRENPEAREFALRGHSLRERLENSNYILLKIPIEIHNLGHGQRLICMDGERLPKELGVTSQEIDSLRQVGLVRPLPQKPEPKIRIDYSALQQTYRRMLADGPFSNQTELARHLGVSRVWVSRVLKGIRRKAD